MTRRSFLLLFSVALLAGGAYLLASRFTYRTGFPLDDAWIHQTYARNLGVRGEWAFLPGQPSAGSTSPLWTALLALGYAVRLPYLAWSYLLGGASLLAVAWLGEQLFRALLPAQARWIPWAGLFLAGEWHLVWASVSGMETLVNAALVLLVLWQSTRARGRGWAWIGMSIGLAVWVRPDSVTLLGPAAVILFFNEAGWKRRAAAGAHLAAGMTLCFAPYLLFNLLLQGSIWPNTFYAKQAEYAAARQAPLLLRYWNELRLPLIGAGLFLLPGFGFFLARGVKERSWATLASGLWFLGYAFLYALRLPVTYQYGRYLIPAMPVYFILGLCGSSLLLARLRQNRAGWLLARVGGLSAALLWLAFMGLGAQRYGQDVAIVETEMVETAQWVAQNTPAESLVAAHDIGAMGYFGQRTLVDLAGLISPQVIPFIGDEASLAAWLDSQQVDYLEVLEDWYGSLPQGKEVVYRSQGRFSPAAGGSHMVVYRWRLQRTPTEIQRVEKGL
jgi:hypothetical protein